ncbi:MAG: hypothetical protein ACLGI6_07200 [Gammaproteobacteria bacterium]
MMPPIVFSAACASAIVLLTACAGAAQGDFPRQLALRPQSSAQLAPNTRLRLDAIDDSRCPPAVQCLWAGVLRYRLTLDAGGRTEQFTLDETTPSHRALAAGLTISLLPGSTAAAASTAARTEPVRLVISKDSHR